MSIKLLNSSVLDTSLNKYLNQIHGIPFLSAEEEADLTYRWRNNRDISAAQTLVVSHLKLVVKVAFRFQNYGLPLIDLISEGNIGLMKAVKKFNPEMKCRLSTYALWWIKAAIQDYILKSWSLVKVASTQMKKKLFYSLNKVKHKLGLLNTSTDVTNTTESGMQIDNQLTTLAQENNTSALTDNSSHSLTQVKNKKAFSSEFDYIRASNVLSLNQSYGEEGQQNELIDILEQEDYVNQEDVLIEKEKDQNKSAILKEAIKTLSFREKHILSQRYLSATPVTLDDLAKHYRISRERVRQIEESAMNKLKKLAQKQCHLFT